MSIAYYNGEFCDFSEVRVPLADRCIFFGDGIYDAAIGKDGGIYLEKEHIDRFFANAKEMNIKLRFSKEEFSAILGEVIEKNSFKQYFLYFQLTRTLDERRHAYTDESGSSLLITVKEHAFANRKLKLITAEDIRYRMCHVKTLNLLPAVIASRAAEERGCDEAVFIRDGIVTECAHSNIFIVRNGVLFTHPEGPFILPGVTRRRVLYFCDKLGIQYAEQKFSKEDLFAADEILVTSTTKLCVKVDEIDGIKVGKCGSKSVADAIISSLKADFESLKY